MTTIMRTELTDARRVVVKVGSSSITTAHGGLDLDRLKGLVDALAKHHAAGRQIVLVSSGAIAAGLAPLGFSRRPKDLASKQAAASIGQGLLIAHYTRLFASYGFQVGQILLTAQDITQRTSYRNVLATMSRLLRLGAIPIVNENDTVATHEIRFGDNDRLAALVAHLVGADALVVLSDVNGLYTAHPNEPGSQFIDRVDDLTALQIDTSKPGKAGLGTGGMTTKLQSAEIATSAGIPVVLTQASRLAAALSGNWVGTYFAPSTKRKSRKLLWLAHGADSCGQLFLDSGAVSAIRDANASLLAAGITKSQGGFLAGDPVDLVAPDGHIVARGLVSYTDEELQSMLGQTTVELIETLGSDYAREVVHRDVLTVLSRFQQDRRVI